MTKNILLLMGIFAAALIASPIKNSGAQYVILGNFELSKLSVQSKSVSHEFSVEVARTERQQRQGLMFRRSLAENAGMLFLYPVAQVLKMWMKNTYFPLDMLFIAADGRIVHIVQRAVPGSLETISSGEIAKAVLEVNGGTTSRLNIKRGDRIKHPAFGLHKY